MNAHKRFALAVAAAAALLANPAASAPVTAAAPAAVPTSTTLDLTLQALDTTPMRTRPGCGSRPGCR